MTTPYTYIPINLYKMSSDLRAYSVAIGLASELLKSCEHVCERNNIFLTIIPIVC